MSKTLITLAFLGLFATVALSQGPTATQSGAFSPLYLNSPISKVFSYTVSADNSTFGAIPNTDTGRITFGPGSTNTTIYVYGLNGSSAAGTITTIYRRTLNATILAGGDSNESSVTYPDTSITANFPVGNGLHTAVSPGGLAALSSGTGSNGDDQVYVTVVTTASTPTAVTNNVTANTNSNVMATLGNIFYDMGSGAYFYTYSLSNTIYVGAVTASTGASYWSPTAITTGSTSISAPVVGNNNWLASQNIIVAWKDMIAMKTNYNMIGKGTSPSVASSNTLLVADTATAVYTPVAVWASNATYGIACQVEANTSSPVTYTITNFLNLTNASNAGFASSSNAVVHVWAWMVNGTADYTLISEWAPATTTNGVTTYGNPTYYTANYTTSGNMTGSVGTLATFSATDNSPVDFFEDVNGSYWVGWTDANANTYTDGYVARVQYDDASSANVLTTIFAFAAFCLAAVYAF